MVGHGQHGRAGPVAADGLGDPVGFGVQARDCDVEVEVDVDVLQRMFDFVPQVRVVDVDHDRERRARLDFRHRRHFDLIVDDRAGVARWQARFAAAFDEVQERRAV